MCPVLLVPGQRQSQVGTGVGGCWGYGWDRAAEWFTLQVWGGGALQSCAGTMAGMGTMAGSRMMAGMGR